MEQKVAGLTVFEQAWAWFETNKKLVAWGIGVVIVIGFIVAYYAWSQGEKEVRAGQALSDAVAASLSGANRAESADAYLKVAAAHPRTAAGARAALAAAGALFTQGQFAEAHKHFQNFTRDYPDSPFRNQALLGAAACLDAQGKSEEAAQAYRQLIDRNLGDLVSAQAKFALARIYETQNKSQEARDLYEDVARAQSQSSLGNEAAFRAEELRQKPLVAPSAIPVASETLPFPIMSAPPAAKTNQP